jgi:polyhydroxyalkanoate synthesis regulator protein
MAKNDGQIVIKKYANRRLYNTGTSTYVTLDDLAVMVKKGEDFTVQDAKIGRRHHPFGADADHLRAGIEDRQHAAADLLPAPAHLVLRRPDADGRAELSGAFHAGLHGRSRRRCASRSTRPSATPRWLKNLQLPMQLVEEQVRRNTEMFQQAMQMFSPFGAVAKAAEDERGRRKASDPRDLNELKDQLKALQEKLDRLGE